MIFSPRHFSVEKEFPLAIEQVWDLLSNTERLNRTLGLPAINYSPPTGATEGFYRKASTQLLKTFSLTWKEYPFEWIYPERYTVLRLFEGGFLERFFGGIELQRKARGTQIRIFTHLTPGNLLGWLLVPLIGRKGVRDTLNYCQTFLTLTQSKAEDPFPRPKKRNPLPSGSFNNLFTELASLPVDKSLIPRLRHLFLQGSEAEIVRMKPFALAEAWKADRYEVLRFFLYATKIGLLNLSWELMCPYCRVIKAEYETLTELSSRFHCDACGIDYEANFDQYVELRFSVHPRVRRADYQTHCIGGPAHTPHVLAQQYLPPDTGRELFLTLGEEDLRVRAFRYNQIVMLKPSPEKIETLDLLYGEEGWQTSSLTYRPGPVRIRLWNKSSKVLLALLEKVQWDPYAVPAAYVTTLQEFRSLFSSEVLAPDQQIGIENLSIFFTDLKGSTSLYEEIGETSAFNRVRTHFQFLTQRIRRHEGAIVKTIGDAVMAVFSLPERAIQTALEIQSEIENFNRSLALDPPLIIKIGIHHGPAIAVNANDRLDYFGRTVNIAARVQRESLGGDVVLTQELFQDPRVQKVLKDFQIKVDTFQTALKGIEGTFTLCRLCLSQPQVL